MKTKRIKIAPLCDVDVWGMNEQDAKNECKCEKHNRDRKAARGE